MHRAEFTHIECVIQVEIGVAVEMASHEVMNLRLGSCMSILELVHSLEFYYVQSVGKDAVGFALKQVLRLIGSDMRDSREDIGTMCCRTLDTVSVVYTAFSSFVVDVKVLKVVIEIYTAGT